MPKYLYKDTVYRSTKVETMGRGLQKGGILLFMEDVSG